MGLKKCLNCPKFKAFMKKNMQPKGYAAGGFVISKYAQQYNFKECPICNTPFEFDDRLGFWKCKKCNKKDS